MRIPGTESTELTQQLTLLHRCRFLPIQVELFLSARGCISAQPLHFVCCGHLPPGATATCCSGILHTTILLFGGCLADWKYFFFMTLKSLFNFQRMISLLPLSDKLEFIYSLEAWPGRKHCLFLGFLLTYEG